MPSEAFGSRQKPLSRTPRLACALSHNADLLILDEATAGLDPLARDELLDELRDYASTGNRGVLLSSHITSDLERIADRVVGINAGSIIFDIPRKQITDIAGIAHSTANQAQRILACVDGARVAKREFSCYVLVPNRFEFAEPFLVKFGNTKGGALPHVCIHPSGLHRRRHSDKPPRPDVIQSVLAWIHMYSWQPFIALIIVALDVYAASCFISIRIFQAKDL